MNIFNAEGQLMLSKTNILLNSSIDISSFPSGIYTIVITNDKAVHTSKIVKD